MALRHVFSKVDFKNIHRLVSCRFYSEDKPRDTKNGDQQTDSSSTSEYTSRRRHKRQEINEEVRMEIDEERLQTLPEVQALNEFLDHKKNPVVPEGQIDFPSDLEQYKRWYQSQERKAFRPKVDPEDTNIILFPGQGSQFVGMGKKLLQYPSACNMYELASSILGYDLLKLCLDGPKDQLDRTVVCQLAVMVTSLAAVEKVREDTPQVIENCISTAGFSVGEYSALVFAGALSFEQAVKLVKVRAEVMQAASEATPSGMMTVFCDHKTKLPFALKVAREICEKKHNIEKPICQIANYLYPECKVIAGNEEALQFLAKNGKDFGIRRSKRLAVSGAFHTPIMEPGILTLTEALKKVDFQEPVFPVYCNVKADRYMHSSKFFVRNLKQHLTKSVKWEQILHVLYSRKIGVAFPHTYEIGPGRQLGTLLKMVNLKAYENYHSVEV